MIDRCKPGTTRSRIVRRVAAALSGMAISIFAYWSALTGYFMFACHHGGQNFDYSGGPFWGWFWDAADWALLVTIVTPFAFPLSILAVAAMAWLYVAIAPFSSCLRFIRVTIISMILSIFLLPLAYWIARLIDVYENCSIGF